MPHAALGAGSSLQVTPSAALGAGSSVQVTPSATLCAGSSVQTVPRAPLAAQSKAIPPVVSFRMAKTIPLEVIEKLPKTDLHVHLDGSLRLKTILDLAEKQRVERSEEHTSEL